MERKRKKKRSNKHNGNRDLLGSSRILPIYSFSSAKRSQSCSSESAASQPLAVGLQISTLFATLKKENRTTQTNNDCYFASETTRMSVLNFGLHSLPRLSYTAHCVYFQNKTVVARVNAITFFGCYSLHVCVFFSFLLFFPFCAVMRVLLYHHVFVYLFLFCCRRLCASLQW